VANFLAGNADIRAISNISGRRNVFFEAVCPDDRAVPNEPLMGFLDCTGGSHDRVAIRRQMAKVVIVLHPICECE
jgi:hypothetical protein